MNCIVEFKSEKDSLSVRDYNRVLAYALLYSSFENIPILDMTATFSLTVKPRMLFKHLQNERGLGLLGAGDGITYITGEILPVQILESKKLPEDENLFINGLRSGNEAGKMSKILKKYDKLFGLETKNIYIDKLIQANPEAYEEVTKMSAEVKDIVLKIANEDGWFAERDAVIIEETAREVAIETARKLLSFGDPIDKIAAVTNLPAEEILELA